MTVTKRTRFEVLRRDDYTCRYCHSTESKLTVDHVTPRALGGDDSPSNLVACCIDCNTGKSSSTPDASLVAEVEEKAIAWAKARAKVVEEMEREVLAERRQLDPFVAAWDRWDPDHAHLPLDWRDSIALWLSQGMTMPMILDALDIALGKRFGRRIDVFRYMAGIVNNWIRQVQERTSQEVAAVAERPSEPTADASLVAFIDRFKIKAA